MKEIQFKESIENLDYTRNHIYLLNFWHTTKLNKEFEFIKRNGLHPSLTVTESYNGNQDVSVSEGNDITTAFYTTFRIFLENIFGKAKVVKQRDRNEWTVSWNTDKVVTLDNYPYLLCFYAKEEGLGQIEPILFSGWTRDLFKSLSIRLRNTDTLHSKELLNSLERIEEHATLHIGNKIPAEMDNIFVKLKSRLGISTKALSKKKATPEEVFVDYQPDNGWRNITPQVNIEFERDREILTELLPYYNQLNHSVRMMAERTRFSYILSFARASGNNIVINRIQDTDANFRAFMALTNNMTDTVAA